MPRITFGKYNGEDFRDIPVDYLQWLLQQTETTRSQLLVELRRRGRYHAAAAPPEPAVTLPPIVENIIQAGYRSLAKQYHPDHGGSNDAMRDLNLVVEKLRKVAARSTTR